MRSWLAGLFAVLVLVGSVAGIYFLLFAEPAGPSREEQAERIVAEYAAAWADADWEAMARLAIEPPDDFVPRHAGMWDDLEVIGAEVRPGEVRVDRGRADASLDVVLTLGGLGDWAYETDVILLRRESDWRVAWELTTLHPSLREDLRFARRGEEPVRAPILAHDGTALTAHGRVYDVGLHPERIEDRDEVVAAFAEHVGVPSERVERLLDRPDLRPEWFYPLVTVHEHEHDRIWPRLRPVAGIVFRVSEARITPTHGFAHHVVGVVGEITAELLEELGDPYQRGDVVGLFGLERVFEESLAGAPAAEVLLVEIRDDDEIRPRTTLHRFEPQPPEPLHTTLDLAVQSAVEEALAGVDEPAAVVVLDASTGAVRAAASRPLAGFNRALTGLYPPGSTFKIVTAAAILEAGADPDDEVACPGEVLVGGLRVRNAGGLALGAISFADTFAQSCNTTFARLGADLDAGLLDAAARAFGFDIAYEIGLPAAGGRFPTPGDPAERAAASIGQGRVEASPLHMASVAAAVASGAWRAPHLLADSGAAPERALTPGVADALDAMMRRVVADGTGQEARVPGTPVAGKTGSAQFGTGDATHAWFVGHRDGLAFAVLVEAGGAGGEVAAPIAARLLRALDGA